MSKRKFSSGEQCQQCGKTPPTGASRCLSCGQEKFQPTGLARSLGEAREKATASIAALIAYSVFGILVLSFVTEGCSEIFQSPGPADVRDERRFDIFGY